MKAFKRGNAHTEKKGGETDRSFGVLTAPNLKKQRLVGLNPLKKHQSRRQDALAVKTTSNENLLSEIELQHSAPSLFSTFL